MGIISTVLVFLMLCMPVRAEENSFYHDYTALNGVLSEDGEHCYAPVELKDDGVFVYMDCEEVIRFLREGTGIVYFGFPECPWCRCLLPVLAQAAQEAHWSEPIYAFNALDLRNELELNVLGQIVTVTETTPEYDAILDVLHDWLGEYKGLNDPEIKRLYFPTVVFMNGGEIVAVHLGTLEAQTDPYISLTQEQQALLLEQLTEKIAMIR